MRKIPRKPVSLRSTLATLTIAVAVLAVLVAGALVLLTNALHSTTIRSTLSVESVRLAEEAELDLLLHHRATDPLVQRAIEGDLLRRLREARSFATTDEDSRALAEAVTKAEGYVAVARDPLKSSDNVSRSQQAAYTALENLIAVNVAQARSAQRHAAHWDAVGNVLGIGVGALVLVFAGGLLAWLNTRAFEPVLGLAVAMERFGRGDREVRAAEQGPREIQEMCVRFNDMAAAIAAQRQAQMAFLGGVAHDLRSPLNTLQLSVEMLGRDRQPSEQRLRQTIDRIARQTARMDRMLGDFLDLARIEAGQLELRFDTRDLRTLVDGVVELFQEGSAGRSIEVRIPDDSVLVRCDPLRVEQVITNLISNALKYSPSGSTIEVVLAASGAEAVLSVSDHGLGMLEEDRARIFEPFRRVGLSKESVAGVGLGLFVVRKIVEAHDGRIEVDSVPGLGSTFRVFLPARKQLEKAVVHQLEAPLPAH